MKSKLLIIASFVFMVAIISSCTKNPAKVLPKKDGKWTATVTFTETYTNTSTTETSHLTFTESAGTITDAYGDVENFTWSYDKSSKKITLVIDSEVDVFDVKDAKTKSETWDLATIDGVSASVAQISLHLELKRD